MLASQDSALLADHSWQGNRLQQKKHFLLEVVSVHHEAFHMSQVIRIQACMFVNHSNNGSQFHK